MRSLPFIQAPDSQTTRRVGNAASGVLELAVYGGLTVGESAFISDEMSKQQSAFVKGAQIADAMSQAEGISISEAFSIIEDAIAGKQLEPEADAIRSRHAAAITDVARIYTTAGQANMVATVTALVRYRCGMDDWSLTDTGRMHRALFNDIWELAKEEQDAEQNKPEPPSEEELGKQPPASGSRAKRTGRKSSGS